MQKSFTNELGNKIDISVSSDSDGITYKIIGPDSETENTITVMEAKELVALLSSELARRSPAGLPAALSRSGAMA